MAARIFTFLVFLSFSLATFAGHKATQKVVSQLQRDITYLASDSLEGRRTGTDGEHKAADYIEARYRTLKIDGYKGQYRYPFQFTYGRDIDPATQIGFNGAMMQLMADAFPMPYSGSAHVANDVLLEVTEQGNIWMVPLYADKDQSEDPHFDCEKHMYDYARDAKKGGATAVVFYDAFGSKFAPEFNKQDEHEALDLPVVFLKHPAFAKIIHQADDNASQKIGISVNLNVSVTKTQRTGTNITAYIDNGAPYTVVIGAHYDHLGYGEDGNSLHANAVKEHQIHHGADDNASGTAALMEIARWAKGKKLKHFNYLFIHFSGEELGLYGSKAFVKDQKIDSAQVAYMINMDMVGRLNDSTRALTLGGVGTSPSWAEVVVRGNDDFKLVIDSAGVGPSDHTSFYHAGIPVLFFFTGTHKDYHKPTDVATSINYPGEVKVIKYAEDVIVKMDKARVKPQYTVTKQTSTGGRSKYKVTMGIMPDYSYQEGGVRVDGVTEGKPASKAGVKAGDIIIQLGDVKVQSMQSYMEALGKLTPGDKTEVKLKRDGKEITLPVEFAK